MTQAISKIEDGEDDIRPVIVRFQNSELQKGEEKQLKTGIFRKRDTTKIVAVATKSMVYTGTINKEVENNDLYSQYLLVSNRKTGKVRLVAVDSIILTPQLDQNQKDIPDSSNNLNVGTLSQLNKEFGSKKIKRITEQRERLKMNIDDVKEQLEQTVTGVDVGENDSFFIASAENDSEYRPRINRDASTPEEVYDLSEIVPEKVLDSLGAEAANVLSSDLDNLELSTFIKQKIMDLQNSSVNDVINKCKLLLYVDYLIKFIIKPVRSMTKKFILCSSSNEVNNYILDHFSVHSNTGRSRPLSMRDKAICHVLVLTMIACDYQVDIESLSKNIKLGVKKIQEMGRILAFTTQDKNKNIMILKIPLPPAVSISPRKRKK